MSLFKMNNSSSSSSKKNKTASATSTPYQTPRASVDLKTSPLSTPTATASSPASQAIVSRATYLNNMQAMDYLNGSATASDRCSDDDSTCSGESEVNWDASVPVMGP
ncbi:hypothetical protein BGZ95_005340 [Linnemannia exigua]|uniref:Uncharacterized protein n=1 Tax=Linnemannia exigua TaxID=604196 RepID=A0AAD4H9U4_9FUNG|nr:hypothetical protein BGZ95_005340 [Linnemannia exigua]